MQRSPVGLLLVAVGAVLMAAGLLAWLGWLSWFGRLPGDIRIERPGFRLYVPLASMLIASVLLTLLSALFRRFRP